MAHRTHGPEIARLRLERGLTLQRLADEASISRSHLGKIELGERGASPPALKRLAIALGVPVSHIAEMPPERASRALAARSAREARTAASRVHAA